MAVIVGMRDRAKETMTDLTVLDFQSGLIAGLGVLVMLGIGVSFELIALGQGDLKGLTRSHIRDHSHSIKLPQLAVSHRVSFVLKEKIGKLFPSVDCPPFLYLLGGGNPMTRDGSRDI